MKKWYQSKTMWVNLLTLGVGVLAVFTGSEWIMANPQAAAVLVAVSGTANMLLRLFTSEAIQ